MPPTLDEMQGAVHHDSPARLGVRATVLVHNHPWLEWVIPAALCAVMLGLVLLSGRQLSQTADEATHLYSGYRYLKCGDLTVSPEHPPLAKLIAAAPLLAMNFAVECTPFQGDNLHQAFASLNWLYSQNWPVALARARVAVSVFGVGLCLLVWITARRMFGVATAIVASLLLIFEPNVLAYSPLVLTDVPVTCMLLFAVLGFYLWADHRSTVFFLLTALAAGLTLLAKHSGVVVMPILGLLAIADALRPRDDRRPMWRLAVRNLMAVALICTVAFGIVWAGYGMRFAAQTAAPQLHGLQPPVASISGRVRRGLEEHHLLPEAYLKGFDAALVLSKQGSVAFVAGQVYSHAPWFSTPLSFVIRSTPALLTMILPALFGAAIGWRRNRREYLFLLVPLAVYLAVCVHASSNVSIRYLLPMFPFLLIAVAAGSVELARRVRWAAYAVPCLIVLHAASSLRAYPNYLSYANDMWGGSAQAYKYLPGLDLGQAYPEAKAYLEQHPAENCWLITAWQWDPNLYDVPCHTFGLYLNHEMPPRVHGTIIVSSTLLTDVRLAEGQIAAAFKNATPAGHIGGSALVVYEGDFDTSLDAAAGESSLAMHAFNAGQFSDALEHGERAIKLAPGSPLTHANLCLLLAPTQVESALEECYTARRLLLTDPLRYETTRKVYLDSLESSIAALREQYKAIYGHVAEIVPSVEAARR